MEKGNIDLNLQRLHELLDNIHEKYQSEIKSLQDKIRHQEETIRSLQRINSQVGTNEINSRIGTEADLITQKGITAKEKIETFLSNPSKRLISTSEWNDLIKYYQFVYLDFYLQIRSHSIEELSKREIFVCLLVRDGYNSYEIQRLLHLSSERVSSIYRNLNRALFGLDTSKGFVEKIEKFNPQTLECHLPDWLPR